MNQRDQRHTFIVSPIWGEASQCIIVVKCAHPTLISPLFVRAFFNIINYIICRLPNKKKTKRNNKGDDVTPDTVERVYGGSQLELRERSPLQSVRDFLRVFNLCQ